MPNHKELELLARIFFPQADQYLVYAPASPALAEGHFTSLTNLQEQLTPTSVILNLSKETINPSFNCPILQLYPTRQQASVYYYICNPDGSIRWLTPAGQRSAYFLHLYNSNGWRGYILSLIWQFTFWLGLGAWVTHGSLSIVGGRKRWLELPLAGQSFTHHAIFTGTKGENRKAVIAQGNAQAVAHFAKLPLTPAASRLTAHEKEVLQAMSEAPISGWTVPTARTYGPSLAVGNVQAPTGRTVIQFCNRHLEALHTLYEAKAFALTIGDWCREHNMSQRLQDIDTKRLTQSLAPAKIDHIYRLLTRLFDQLEEGQSMPACLAHGDFTPWNLFLTTNGIAVYDWELAAVQPLAFDAFHFIVQAGILIQRKSAAEIHTQVKALLQHPQLGEWFADERQFVASWRMYLLHHISYYLLRYLRQVDLHEQVYWQLDAWVNLLEIEAAQPSTLPKLSSYE